VNLQPLTGPSSESVEVSAIAPGYMSGFGNKFETEAMAGALPLAQNSPQECHFGLYAEQLSGSPFTTPRSANLRSWLYRIQPTLAHWGDFRRVGIGDWLTAPIEGADVPFGPLRWDPIAAPDAPTSFIEGVRTISMTGNCAEQVGMAVHVYVANRPMEDEYFYSTDGEILLVLQEGALEIRTELGVITANPAQIVVIPRGIKFSVCPIAGIARGYVCENYGTPFVLPELGPIGANGLANPRDFLAPIAAYEDKVGACSLYVKSGGAIWLTSLDRSPLDVVAWHGNYAPYKYDLRRFSPVGPLLFDHADPSIFTVLTSPSHRPGTANVDFVLFSDRWLVAEKTFRLPWYHMNVMSEFMGLLYGRYDAKPHGFMPGGFSLHNCMLPHGPDADAFESARRETLSPRKLEGAMSFMFETCLRQKVTPYAAALPELQKDYPRYGRRLKARFNSTRRGA
jgi:homogentisate 1,2-dioxygenase